MKTGRMGRSLHWGIWFSVLLPLAAFAQPTQTVTFSPASAVFSGSVTVELSGAANGQEIRYVVATGPGAADVEVRSDSPVYAGPIVVSTTALIRAAVFTAGSSAAGRATSGYYLRQGADLAPFTSRLPVLVLDDLGAGPLVKDNINHASWLFGFAPTPAGTLTRAPDFATPLTATVRGTSSAEFPKKGYNLRMRDAANRARAFPIFDLPAYERWALVAPWSFDATFFNNAFMYDLSNRIGRWAPRTKLVEMFFNTTGDDLGLSDYHGIFIVTDRIRIEPGRVDIDALSSAATTAPAITGGYVIKIDARDADEIGWVTERGVPAGGTTEIVLVEPGAEDITPAQFAYIKDYVQQMENALHADRAAGWTQRTYLDFIDRASWVDHHILNVLASNPDALHRSAYFTKPRAGRLQAGPIWDFDRSLGGFWDDRTSVVNTWSGLGGAVDVWKSGWWGILAEDPEFIQEWVDRWQSLRRSELSTNALTSLAQSYADTIGDAAVRDVARWPDSASPRGSYQDQIAYLKNWLTQRAEWIDSQFVAAPAIDAQGTAVTFTPPPGALLAYTLDGSDPRAIGGGVSASATTHAGALTLPISAGARVRSYQPALAGQFPSSAWSMPVQQSRSSFAAAQGRIVNLSTKAFVGSGSETLIMGFVVADADAKRYLVRAVGPGLRAFGETGTLGSPALTVTSSQGSILAQNESWDVEPVAGQVRAAAQAVGAFPLSAGSADAATLASLTGGTYTAQITPRIGDNGVALAEIYELEANGRTTNLSVRGRVRVNQPLTGGFVLGGAGSTRLLIRAVGPTLRLFGVGDAATDPSFILRSGQNVVASNDTWAAGANASMVTDANRVAGAFTLNAGSQDAALVALLPAGPYTVEVNAAGDGGIVLFEIYELP